MTAKLSAEELDALQRLAEGATPGPWSVGIDGNDRIYGPDGTEHAGMILIRGANKHYIAAANPATLLRLLAEIERLGERQLPQSGNIRISIDTYEAMLRKDVDQQAEIVGLLAQVNELRPVCEESNAVCACGCPPDEHENYGEDGECCNNPEHKCVRTSYAVAAMLADALAQVREAEAPEALRKAARVILRGFHEGVFVRSIDGDQRPDWAVRLLPFVAALSEVKSIVGDPCLNEDCPVHGGPNSEGQA